MVNNFHEIITSMQAEIDKSLVDYGTKKEITANRYLLEQVASEMLMDLNLKKLKSQSKLSLSDSSC